MKCAATTLLIGALVGTIAMPAIAREAPNAPDDMAGPGMRGMGGGHRHMNWVLRAYNNRANGNVYTMMGMEMLRSSANGWYGGFGWYKGLNLGMTPGADAASQGGLLVGKDFGEGPLTLGVGLLVGLGYSLVASPTLTFSNFAAYFVGEPRINLGWVMGPHAELELSAGYLGTTSPSMAGGPTVMLTLSMIRMGMMKGMGAGGGMCPTCGR
ncbi:MAG TPA: hypothetical protein V6D05_07710 [Stenomitos sp.]